MGWTGCALHATASNGGKRQFRISKRRRRRAKVVQLAATARKRAREVSARRPVWASPRGARTHYPSERTLAVPTLRGSALPCSGWLVVVNLPSRPAGQTTRIGNRTAAGAGEQNDQRRQKKQIGRAGACKLLSGGTTGEPPPGEWPGPAFHTSREGSRLGSGEPRQDGRLGLTVG
jgi:hypothetical protein